ncbi:hypothetical protein CROQUDRAFT_89356 [Cronartium quercuum f. sp. fusiforme G11]|uniref:Uncharacterized protein n=1 Tax=Cronartium quercuum f. sp. fusiforme G11 TaxID=708437 RepID=A0A9P6TE97_9BASI|nr:hypothetical protein CROQUDRAFT_89356 [Cronartium quercuum f. sp. fusiforme G11]
MWLSSRVVWLLALLFYPTQSLYYPDLAYFEDCEQIAKWPSLSDAQPIRPTTFSPIGSQSPSEMMVTPFIPVVDTSEPPPMDQAMEKSTAEPSTSDSRRLASLRDSSLLSPDSSDTAIEVVDIPSSSSGSEQDGFQAGSVTCVKTLNPDYAFDSDNSNHIDEHELISTEASSIIGRHKSGVTVPPDNSPLEVHKNPTDSQRQKRQKFRGEEKPASPSTMRPDQSTFQVAYGSPSFTKRITLEEIKKVLNLHDTESVPMRDSYNMWLTQNCEIRRIFGLFQGVDPKLFRSKVEDWTKSDLYGIDENSFAKDLRPKSKLLYPELPESLPNDSVRKVQSDWMEKHLPKVWAPHSKAIQFLVTNPKFSSKDAWYSAQVLGYLETTHKEEFRRSTEWFRNNLENYDDRIKMIHESVKESVLAFLQTIVNSFEMKLPVQGDAETQASYIRAIKDVLNAWLYAFEDDGSKDDYMRARFHGWLRQLKPTEYEKREDFLKTLTDYVVNHLSQQLIFTIRQTENDQSDTMENALRFWNIYHDDSMPFSRVQQGVNKIFDNPHYLGKAKKMLSRVEAHRRRTQARFIYWLPQAFQYLFQKDTTQEQRLEAAEAILIVRKDLEFVSTYCPTEIKVFQDEMIDFMGLNSYKGCMQQLTKISDGLREMMYINKLLSQDKPFDSIGDIQAFVIRHHLDSFMTSSQPTTSEPTSFQPHIDVVTQTGFFNLVPHPSPVLSRVFFLGKINKGAERYRISVLQKAITSIQRFPDELNHIIQNMYEKYKYTRSLTSKEDWETSLQKIANRNGLSDKDVLEWFSKFEANGKASVALFRWKVRMESLSKQMKTEYIKPLQDMGRKLGLTKEPRTYDNSFTLDKKGMMFALKYHPHHYLLSRTLEGILGSEFWKEKVDQAFGKPTVLQTSNFYPAIPASEES